MRFRGEFVLLSGSASQSCGVEKLSRAHDAIRALTRTILEESGGLIVFASSEPTSPDNPALPLVFDWTALRALETFLLEQTGDQPATHRAIVVTSNKATTRKMSEENRGLLRRLSARSAIDVVCVDDDLHTGGNLRDAQIARAGAMIAIGGGKGVVDLVHKVCARGGVAFPMDIVVGAFSGDGEGAQGLHRRLLADCKTFFPHTHASVRGRIPSLSLETRDAEPIAVARGIIDLIAAERAAAAISAPDVAILTALPVELGAVKAALGLSESEGPLVLPSGTQWLGRLIHTSSGPRIGVVVTCIGTAGNADAAAAATEIIAAFHPRLLIMVGIAAGMRGRTRIGEVVVSERIVAYEPAAFVASPVPAKEPRPEHFRPDHATQQRVVAYLSGGQPLIERLASKRAASGVVPPAGALRPEFADGLSPRPATLATGEKLLRDPERFRMLRANLHGKIEAVEMEAAGIAIACGRSGTSYLVIRGISDFGDGEKNDGAHVLAATAAAIVAVDFAEYGYSRSI